MERKQSIDGSNLQSPREPGSDALLSDEVKARIAQIIEEWHEQHADERRRQD